MERTVSPAPLMHLLYCLTAGWLSFNGLVASRNFILVSSMDGLPFSVTSASSMSFSTEAKFRFDGFSSSHT